jgi:hypothetical protein
LSATACRAHAAAWFGSDWSLQLTTLTLTPLIPPALLAARTAALMATSDSGELAPDEDDVVASDMIVISPAALEPELLELALPELELPELLQAANATREASTAPVARPREVLLILVILLRALSKNEFLRMDGSLEQRMSTLDIADGSCVPQVRQAEPCPETAAAALCVIYVMPHADGQ